jgi:hypothetical protein
MILNRVKTIRNQQDIQARRRLVRNHKRWDKFRRDKETMIQKYKQILFERRRIVLWLTLVRGKYDFPRIM